MGRANESEIEIDRWDNHWVSYQFLRQRNTESGHRNTSLLLQIKSADQMVNLWLIKLEVEVQQ